MEVYGCLVEGLLFYLLLFFIFVVFYFVLGCGLLMNGFRVVGDGFGMMEVVWR